MQGARIPDVTAGGRATVTPTELAVASTAAAAVAAAAAAGRWPRACVERCRTRACGRVLGASRQVQIQIGSFQVGKPPTPGPPARFGPQAAHLGIRPVLVLDQSEAMGWGRPEFYATFSSESGFGPGPVGTGCPTGSLSQLCSQPNWSPCVQRLQPQAFRAFSHGIRRQQP